MSLTMYDVGTELQVCDECEKPHHSVKADPDNVCCNCRNPCVEPHRCSSCGYPGNLYDGKNCSECYYRSQGLDEYGEHLVSDDYYDEE